MVELIIGVEEVAVSAAKEIMDLRNGKSVSA